MIVSHDESGYVEDEATKAFQILKNVVSGAMFESSIKTYQHTRNIRDAFLALCQHNLGASSMRERIVETAETYLIKVE